MARKPTRLKKLRLMELSLVHAGANQHSSIGIYKAAEPEPAPMDISKMAEVLKDATPEVLAIVKSQIDSQNKWLEEFRKQNDERNTTMTNTDPNAAWHAAVAAYAEKHDLPLDRAGVELVKNRPDIVAAAHAEGEKVHRQRQIDERRRIYGE